MTDTMRILNVILSMAALPPAILLLRQFIKEGRDNYTKTNKILQAMFAGFIVIAIANSTVSLLGLNNFAYATEVSRARSIFVSTVITIVSWAMYFIAHPRGK